MIPQTDLTWQTPNCQPLTWQQELAAAISDPEELFSLLELDVQEPDVEDDNKLSLAAATDFPLRVPHAYLSRIRKGDINDPLLRQILPLGAEVSSVPGYSKDPLQEADANPAPGLVHKYQSRVLLIVSPACAINCRYCFRRHFPYTENNPSRRDWQQALQYIASDTRINEVILSGGDPLAANDRFLIWLTQEIASITHIKRLRVHTRLPVVIPSRIDDHCLAWLTNTRLQTLMVLHINHPNEIDSAVADSLARLKQAGITLLNQSVLLKSVNDSADTLVALSEKLLQNAVFPYYLHLLDPVAGAAHFDISKAQALHLHQQLQTRLPGYLVPKLVREEAGATAKTLIF